MYQINARLTIAMILGVLWTGTLYDLHGTRILAFLTETSGGWLLVQLVPIIIGLAGVGFTALGGLVGLIDVIDRPEELDRLHRYGRWGLWLDPRCAPSHATLFRAWSRLRKGETLTRDGDDWKVIHDAITTAFENQWEEAKERDDDEENRSMWVIGWNASEEVISSQHVPVFTPPYEADSLRIVNIEDMIFDYKKSHIMNHDQSEIYTRCTFVWEFIEERMVRIKALAGQVFIMSGGILVIFSLVADLVADALVS